MLIFFDGFSFMLSYLLSSKFEFQQLSKPSEHCDLSTITFILNCIKVYLKFFQLLRRSANNSTIFCKICFLPCMDEIAFEEIVRNMVQPCAIVMKITKSRWIQRKSYRACKTLTNEYFFERCSVHNWF